jgi:hypothetical protein
MEKNHKPYSGSGKSTKYKERSTNESGKYKLRRTNNGQLVTKLCTLSFVPRTSNYSAITGLSLCQARCRIKSRQHDFSHCIRFFCTLISLEVKSDHVYMHLVEHYEKSLGAIHIGNRIMIINTQSALQLINRYF